MAIGQVAVMSFYNNEALSSGEPKPIISNVARGPKARGQHWKLLAESLKQDSIYGSTANGFMCFFTSNVRSTFYNRLQPNDHYH